MKVGVALSDGRSDELGGPRSCIGVWRTAAPVSRFFAFRGVVWTVLIGLRVCACARGCEIGSWVLAGFRFRLEGSCTCTLITDGLWMYTYLLSISLYNGVNRINLILVAIRLWIGLQESKTIQYFCNYCLAFVNSWKYPSCLGLVSKYKKYYCLVLKS